MHHPIELLAPARDLQTGLVAIDHGADAVYIGGPSFGARANAGNTLDDIAKLSEYAHRYHAKVFVTLNTLLKNDEIDAARQMAFDIASAGADVLIVQDMGLLNGPLPDIELHASTQCDIRTPEKARFLEKVGFSQMVLARELSLTEVRAIADVLTTSRIEYFIHGALCVSYSGQCYISEAMTKRSANRGTCSQQCRLPYDVQTLDGHVIAQAQHVLSLHDNDQRDNLEALIDAGASSFKIEGRLKDSAYVRNITAYYRQRLDDILARRPELKRTSVGHCTYSFTPSPEKVFNRGRTDYFVHGKSFEGVYDMVDLTSPKVTGQKAARIERVESKRIVVKPFADVVLANGDGLTYLHQDLMKGLRANRVEPLGKGLVAIYTPQSPQQIEGLRPGLLLNRNRDHAFLKEMAGQTGVRKIPITLILTHYDDTLDLTVCDGTYSASASVAMDFSVAQNLERNRQALQTNLSKLGQTIYSVEDLYIPEDFDRFVPASVANDLRRQAIANLDVAREAGRPKAQRAPVDATYPYPQKFIGFEGNVSNDAARAFYNAHGCLVTQPAFEIKPLNQVALMTCRHCVRPTLNLCPKQLKYHPEFLEQTDRDAFRPEPLVLINSHGERYKAVFHCKMKPCEMTLHAMDDRF